MAYQHRNFAHPVNPSEYLATRTDKAERANYVALVLGALWIIGAFAYAATVPLHPADKDDQIITGGTAPRE